MNFTEYENEKALSATQKQECLGILHYSLGSYKLCLAGGSNLFAYYGQTCIKTLDLHTRPQIVSTAPAHCFRLHDRVQFSRSLSMSLSHARVPCQFPCSMSLSSSLSISCPCPCLMPVSVSMSRSIRVYVRVRVDAQVCIPVYVRVHCPIPVPTPVSISMSVRVRTVSARSLVVYAGDGVVTPGLDTGADHPVQLLLHLSIAPLHGAEIQLVGVVSLDLRDGKRDCHARRIG